jgi:2-C-methyl-D-erythritol 4-phosphate cytidylyltransferase/2-C-methyl-D-erythritol 2,4-cyclodiphosphate synthase
LNGQVPAPADDANPRAVVRADAIVVAAGRSARMGGTDKLSAELAGRPLLAWALDALSAAPEVARIVVVAAPERVADVAAAPWLPGRVIDVVPGGARRQESVHAGFAAFDRFGVDEGGVVLVHDGARPLLSAALVGMVAAETARSGAAIPILPVAETLKRLDGDLVGETIDRTGLGAAQTPQGARRDLLRVAWARYPAAGPETWTDEASLLEAAGIPVRIVAGDPANLKVTRPDDLARAEAALTGGWATRTGIGHDSHPFGPDAPLVLGGVTIPGAPRLYGHSDGDVVLHAVADALLGATGLGDLGGQFPADARTPRGIASAALLRAVCDRLAADGWRPSSADVTVIGARPRLGPHFDAMRATMGELLGLERGAVNVKASSGNLDGADGAGRSISAVAIAMVVRTR